MNDHNPIQKSIEKRLKDERYHIPKKETEKRGFDVQLILIISIILSIILGILSTLKSLF